MKPYGFDEIKNKLRLDSIRRYKHVELKVNDMHIIAHKSNRTRYWNVSILHEEKDTGHDKTFKTNGDFLKYLNAYIETARTPIYILREY